MTGSAKAVIANTIQTDPERVAKFFKFDTFDTIFGDAITLICGNSKCDFEAIRGKAF